MNDKHAFMKLSGSLEDAQEICAQILEEAKEDELLAQGWIQDPDSGEWHQSELIRKAEAYREHVDAFEGELPDSL